MRTSLLFSLLLGPTALAQTPIVDTLVADLDQRPASGRVRSSHPEQPIVQPGRTLFTAATPGLDIELWATDGTPGNLVRIGHLGYTARALPMVAGLAEEGFVTSSIDGQYLLDYLSPFVEPASVEEFGFNREWARMFWLGA